MVGSMYAAISGLRAHQQKMNVIGHNIANVNTFGYKSQRTTFKESMYSSVRTSTGGTATTGGTNAAQIGYGATVGTIDMNMRTGNYAVTDNTLDVMIDGDGFFVTSPQIQKDLPTDGKGGLNGMALTRVGNLNFDDNGYLVDGQGNVVYGFRWNGQGGPAGGGNADGYKADNLQPIRIPDVDGNIDEDITKKRMALSNISINEKGEITGMDEKTQEVKHIGCLALAYVDNPNGLTHMGGPYYRAGGNAGDVRVGSSGGVVGGGNAGGNAGGQDNLVNFNSKIRSGVLEMSNVDISNEFADLITTQRGFQANTKIITVTDEMLSDLVAMKR